MLFLTLATLSCLAKNRHPYTKCVQLVATHRHQHKNLGYNKVSTSILAPYTNVSCGTLARFYLHQKELEKL